MTDQRMFSWREHVQSARLPSTTKLVLLTLSTHMTRMGESCFPTTRQIAWECSLSRTSVMKHLAEAEALGWITRRAHGFAGQRWKNHEYSPAIPAEAKIILWRDSEDGMQAARELESALKAGQPAVPACTEAGQPPLPPIEKAGQGDGPPLPEAGQPPDISWSTSRGNVVKEVDLSSSIALQEDHQDINIMLAGVSIPSSTTDWLNVLCGDFGFERHRIHNANNIQILHGLVDARVDLEQFNTAMVASVIATGYEQPPLGYIAAVIASNNRVKPQRSTRPESKPGYESPQARAQRMAAEDRAMASERMEVIDAR